ncbi:Metalloprotease PmbA [archaeon HR01]|nr:Metalloprotease PmbA [archaeon HR01]
MTRLERLVRLGVKMGASDVCIIASEIRKRMIRFANNEVTVTKSLNESVTGIYVSFKGRRAFNSTTAHGEDALEKLLRTTVKMARSSEPSDTYAPLPSGPFQYDKDLLNYGERDIAPERLSEYVGMAVQGGVDAGASRVAGTLTHSFERKRLVTSAGVDASSESGGLEVSVRAFTDGDATGHFVSVSSEAGMFKPYEAGLKAGEIAVMAKNPEKWEPGVYEALLGNMTFAHLVEQLGIFASAFYVDAGISFLTGRLGEAVASGRLTILDDPTIRQSIGATAFDDEGVRTRRNKILEDGVLSGYLHNSGTARKFGTETTANAGLIVPHPFNLYVQPGDKSLDELISGIDHGIWVTNDWYLRYQNYRSGEFSTIPRDGLFLIKNGSIEKSIRELRISDNILNIFRNVRDVGRDCYWVRWWEVEIPTYAPAVTVERLRFTSSAL